MQKNKKSFTPFFLKNGRLRHPITPFLKNICFCFLLALCLAACTPVSGKEEPPSVGEEITEERVSLQLVLAQDASPEIVEMANEFVRRAEYFSDGGLEINLLYTRNLLSLMKEADLCIVENRRLTDALPPLRTIELPYLLKNGDYMIGALNSARCLKQLDTIIQAEYPMQTEYTALIGYLDIAAETVLDLTDFTRIYRIATERELFLEEEQKELNADFVKLAPGKEISMLHNNEAELVEIRLDELVRTAHIGERKIQLLPTAHRIEAAFVLSNMEKKKSLSQKQKSAVEQAAILASGYCRTLVESKRESDLNILQEYKVPVNRKSTNLEKYFSLLGEVYQYRPEQIRAAFDPQLAKIIRADGPQNAFQNETS